MAMYFSYANFNIRISVLHFIDKLIPARTFICSEVSEITFLSSMASFLRLHLQKTSALKIVQIGNSSF